MEYILLFPRLHNPKFGLSMRQKKQKKKKSNKTIQPKKSGRFGSSRDARLSACRLMETQDKVRHLSDDQPALSIKWQKNKRTCAIIGQRLQYRSAHLFSPLQFDSQLSKANLLKQVLSGREAVLTEILMFVLLPFPLLNIKILSVSRCIFFSFFSLSKAKYDSGSQICTYEACKLIPIRFSLLHGYRRLFIRIQMQKTWTKKR